MSTAHASHSAGAHHFASIGSRAATGVVAGIIGGLVFGAMMAAMGMLPVVAMLVGSNSASVGMLLHLGISIVFGVVFAEVWTKSSFWSLLIAGLVYAAVLWAVGGQLIMPAMLGMPLFAMNMDAMYSLIGHLVYGVLAAATLWFFRRRSVSAK